MTADIAGAGIWGKRAQTTEYERLAFLLAGSAATGTFPENITVSSNALAAPAGDPLATSMLFTTASGGVAPAFVGMWGALDVIRDPYTDAQSGGLRIDNGLRPSPEEIGSFFLELKMVKGEVVASTTYLQDSLRSKGGLRKLFTNILLSPFPFIRKRFWRARVHRFLWLFRPYKVSLAVFKKNK